MPQKHRTGRQTVLCMCAKCQAPIAGRTLDTLALPACAGRLLQAARCPAPVLAARWSEASITMLTPAGGAVLLTHLVPGAPHPVVRLRVG